MNFALPDQDVFKINANGSPPIQVAGPTGFFTGVGTILFNMIANPVSGKVYVANLDSLNDVRFEGPGTFASGFKPIGEPASVRGHLAESRITVLDGASVLPRHLNKHVDYTTCCAPIPNTENDDSIGFPLGMAVSSDGATLYVAGFGSSEVGVYNTAQLEADTFTPSASNQLGVTGGGPASSSTRCALRADPLRRLDLRPQHRHRQRIAARTLAQPRARKREERATISTTRRSARATATRRARAATSSAT